MSATAARLGLRSAAAAAAMRPPPPPPTARPTLAAMPIAGDMQDFAKVLRRWVHLEHAAGGADARYGAGFRASRDIRDLFAWVLHAR